MRLKVGIRSARSADQKHSGKKAPAKGSSDGTPAVLKSDETGLFLEEELRIKVWRLIFGKNLSGLLLRGAFVSNGLLKGILEV